MEEVEARIYSGGKFQTVEMSRQGEYLVVDFPTSRLHRRWDTIGRTITRWEKAYIFTGAQGQSWPMTEEEQSGHLPSLISLLNDTCLVEVEGLLQGPKFSVPYLMMREKDADAFLEWFIPSEKEVDLLGCTITDI
jgi:hypothetical protein